MAKTILYGDIGSERMILNETNLPETMVSAMYRKVSKYAFGYNTCGNTGIWYYVNKYNQRSAGYISCVCQELPSDEEEYDDFSAPFALFEVAFHTIDEFEETCPAGTLRLRNYAKVSYPSRSCIAEMYHRLLEVLPNNDKMIVYIPDNEGKEFFISKAINLLERFLYVVPVGIRPLISFSIGEETHQDCVNISIVSERPPLNAQGILIDTTNESHEDISSDLLAQYWTKCFDDDNNFNDRTEDIFVRCVKKDEIVRGDVHSKIFDIPYAPLYIFLCKEKIEFEDYLTLKKQCRNTIDFALLLKAVGFELSDFIEEEHRRRALEEKRQREAEQRLQEEEKRKAQERERRRADSYEGWIDCLNAYIGQMVERDANNAPEEMDDLRSDVSKKAYERDIEFFSCLNKIAQTKAKTYAESIGSAKNYWTNNQWTAFFDPNLSYILSSSDENIQFDLPYIKILNQNYADNIYSGLLIYLDAIHSINYVDENMREELIKKNPINTDYSYNHCCYGRNVTGIIYYGPDNSRKATFGYRTFLDIVALVCIYVFGEDIKPDSLCAEHMKQETIKKLMAKRFKSLGKLKNIVLYHCVFLYSAIMDFFNFSGRKKTGIDQTMAERFHIAESMKWLQDQLDAKVAIKTYENTLNSFILKKENIVKNFELKKQMNKLHKK